MTNKPPRMTDATLRVLSDLLVRTGEERCTSQISAATGLEPGTVHPILTKFAEIGWLQNYFENEAVAHAQGRPARRYFTFTAEGTREFALVLAQRLRATRSPEFEVIEQPSDGQLLAEIGEAAGLIGPPDTWVGQLRDRQSRRNSGLTDVLERLDYIEETVKRLLPK